MNSVYLAASLVHRLKSCTILQTSVPIHYKIHKQLPYILSLLIFAMWYVENCKQVSTEHILLSIVYYLIDTDNDSESFKSCDTSKASHSSIILWRYSLHTINAIDVAKCLDWTALPLYHVKPTTICPNKHIVMFKCSGVTCVHTHIFWCCLFIPATASYFTELIGKIA